MKIFPGVLIGAGALLAAWFAAVAIESTTRLMAELFAHFGADLPTPTIVTIDAVRNYVPWIVAAVSTAGILFLWVRRHAYFPHACAAVSGLVAISASCAMLALALPLMKCGISWPEWPAAMRESGKPGAAPGVALKADASKTASGVSCK